jgi:hypothetical protein
MGGSAESCDEKSSGTMTVKPADMDMISCHFITKV